MDSTGSNSSGVNTNTIESQRLSWSTASNNSRTTEQPEADGQQPSCSTSSSDGNAPQPQNGSAATNAAAALDTDDSDDETWDHGYIYGVTSEEMSAIRQAILDRINEDDEDYNSDDSGIESYIDD